MTTAPGLTMVLRAENGRRRRSGGWSGRTKQGRGVSRGGRAVGKKVLVGLWEGNNDRIKKGPPAPTQMNAKTCFSSQFWCPNYVTRYKNTPLFFEPSTHALYSTTRVVFRRCPLESPLNTGRWTIRPLVSDVGNLGSSGRARGGRGTTIS